jgi:hypothetical protein
VSIDDFGLRAWFDQYFHVFATCVRGERDIVDVLRFHGVPVIMTSPDGVITATTRDQSGAIMRGEIDALRSAGYHHTNVHTGDVNVINATSALYTATFSRLNHAGAEFNRSTATYLVTERSTGLEISVRAVHG